jgi:hypothetical protein
MFCGVCGGQKCGDFRGEEEDDIGGCCLTLGGRRTRRLSEPIRLEGYGGKRTGTAAEVPWAASAVATSHWESVITGVKPSTLRSAATLPGNVVSTTSQCICVAPPLLPS